MLVYRTPTAAAFYKRKQFHATRKQHTESISDWFKRLQQFIANCEFDCISEYMLIDKFVSGLNEMDFEKISKVATWTLQDLVLVVIGNEHIFNVKHIKDELPRNIPNANVKSEMVSGESSIKFHISKILNEFMFTGPAIHQCGK